MQPGAVIGHSMGEAAAAVVAGALSLDDGVRVICRRSRLMARIAGSGAMASVELPAQQVLSELAARGVDDVVLSVVASPQSTVIGGATQTVRELVAAWEQRDVMAREVAVDVASHSPQVDPILDELAEVLADLDPDGRRRCPYYSATAVRPARSAGVRCRVLGGQPASHGAVRRGGAGGAGGRLPGLRGAGSASAAHPRCRADSRSLDMPLAALAAMRREQELPHGLRGFVADLHSAGAAVDFSVIYPGGRLVDAPLPTWTPPHADADPRRSGVTGTRRLHSSGASADGRACAIARGARAPRLAGRGRHRGASRGWATTGSTTWPLFRVPPTARWRLPRLARSSARNSRSATSVSSRCCCWTRRPRCPPSRR